MKIDCKVPVNASNESIWKVISDYEHMVENISAITKVEIHDRPTDEKSLIGLKWTETRTMFGQEATETMWVTDCVVNDYYQTRAESHGAVYLSKMYITDEEEGNEKQNFVGMQFEGEPLSFCSKFMMSIMGWVFVGETKKALMQDLNDIKAKAESFEST